MHFWIDKRSSYGFGQYQRPGMAGFGYQPRRNRGKASGSNPSAASSSNAGGSSQTRQNVAPSALSQQGKSTNHHHHHHHHRSHHHRTNRGESAITTGDVELQHDVIDNSDLDSHHVPVVHSMYPQDDSAATHPLDSTPRNGESNLLVNQWLPIQIICGLCMILAITLVLLKLYFESYMTGFQVLSLILMSFVLLVLTTLLSLLRSRRRRSSSQLQPHSLVESQAQSTVTSNGQQQTVIVQPLATCEPPPPYALALTLPEKQSDIKITTPPPSYEKINIIQ